METSWEFWLPVVVNLLFWLAIVAGIVQGLGGAVQIRSAPNAGAEFAIYLPVYSTREKMDDSILARFTRGSCRAA